jgi:hypothetical protein
MTVSYQPPNLLRKHNDHDKKFPKLLTSTNIPKIPKSLTAASVNHLRFSLPLHDHDDHLLSPLRTMTLFCDQERQPVCERRVEPHALTFVGFFSTSTSLENHESF